MDTVDAFIRASARTSGFIDISPPAVQLVQHIITRFLYTVAYRLVTLERSVAVKGFTKYSISAIIRSVIPCHMASVINNDTMLGNFPTPDFPIHALVNIETRGVFARLSTNSRRMLARICEILIHETIDGASNSIRVTVNGVMDGTRHDPELRAMLYRLGFVVPVSIPDDCFVEVRDILLRMGADVGTMSIRKEAILLLTSYFSRRIDELMMAEEGDSIAS